MKKTVSVLFSVVLFWNMAVVNAQDGIHFKKVVKLPKRDGVLSKSFSQSEMHQARERLHHHL